MKGGPGKSGASPRFGMRRLTAAIYGSRAIKLLGRNRKESFVCRGVHRWPYWQC